jgi:cytochrome c biogenesis protein ResB
MPCDGAMVRLCDRARAGPVRVAPPWSVAVLLRGLGALWVSLCGLLTSVKFGVLLLVLLAFSAIAGTFTESWFGTPAAQRWVYHAWWFIGLMTVMAVTLNAASWQHYVATWRLPGTRPLRSTPEAFGGLPEVREVAGPVSRERMAAILERRMGRVSGDGAALFAQRGIVQRWGYILTHIGMTLLLGGSVYLSVMAHFFGPPGTSIVWIGEGMSRHWYWVDDPSHPGQMVAAALPFEIRLHDFDADFFPDTQVPRAFTSIVELTDADGERSLHRVNMNEALCWHGWKFSQSSYAILDSNMDTQMAQEFARTDGQGFRDLAVNGRMAIRLVDNHTGRQFPNFDASAGTCVPVPQSDLFFESADGVHFHVLHGSTLIASGMVAGPGVQPKGGESSKPGDQAGSAGSSGGDFSATVVGRLPAAYSGLSVMREPQGLKAFFFVAFFLFLGGPLLAFTSAFRQVWVWIDPEGNRALLGGRVRGRRASLGPLLDRLVADLKETPS